MPCAPGPVKQTCLLPAGLVVAFLLLALPASAGPNLAGNSSFERGMAGWGIWPRTVSPQAPAGDGRHGSRFCRLTSTEAGEAFLYSDAIPVQPESDYTLSAYVRAHGAQGASLSLWTVAAAAPDASWVPATGDGPGGQNLLPNPDFSDGPAGWQLWHQFPGRSGGGIATAPDGYVAYHVTNPGGGGANLHSDPVPCSPNTPYALVVRARVLQGQGVGIGGWAMDAAGGTISYAVGDMLPLPGSAPEARTFTKVFTTPEGCTQLKAHLVCNGGEVWWEDCRIVPLTGSVSYQLPSPVGLPEDQPAWARFRSVVRTPPGCSAVRVVFSLASGTADVDAVQVEPGREAGFYETDTVGWPGRNLLPNSGFEDGDVAWHLWHQFPGVSSGGAVAGEGAGGGAAFHVLNPGEGGANLFSDNVPCEPGRTYTLSVSARVRNGRGVAIAGWGLDGSGGTLSYGIGGSLDLPADVPAFRRFSRTFTAPPGCTHIRAHLVCNGGEVWWDDCQIEEGDDTGAYEPGPRREVMAPEHGPRAVAYARAIIREARLRDVLSQAERMAVYGGAAERDEPGDLLGEARRRVDALSAALDAAYIVPDFAAFDYASIDARAEAAEEALTRAWDALGCDTGDAFADWQPARLADLTPKGQLAEEFLIFPCFTRDYFFTGRCDWDVLAPFGFRIVSGWWGVGCGPDGTLDTGSLDRAVAACLAHGYRCDITIDGAVAAPALQPRLGEDVFLHNAEGGWSPQGNCHNTVNIWHPEVRALAARFLRNLAGRYAGAPGVVSYELTNEPSLTIEKHVHGYEYEPAGVGGYSTQARQAWRGWLRDRYGTVAELNRRWRTGYGGLADVEPPADLQAPVPVDARTPVPCGALHDFQLFRSQSHAGWFRLCLDAMHEGDPGKAVISQFVSPPIQRKDAAVDLRTLVDEAPWDFYGTHDWPGERTALESLYAVSMNRQAGLPHWEDEFIWSQWERKGTPEPVMRAALERNLWRQIAWGKRGISLFNLESEWAHDSPSNWNNSMMNIEADLAVPRYSTGVIPTIERKVNLFKDELYATRLGPCDVAVLRPTTATLVTGPEGVVKAASTGITEWLMVRRPMPLIVPEEHIIAGGGLDGVRCLIAPMAVNVPDDLQDILLEWVQGGGRLFAVGPFGLFDECGRPTGTLLKRTVGDLDWRFDRASGQWQFGPDARPANGARTVGKPGEAFACADYGRGEVLVWSHTADSTEQLMALETQVYDGSPPLAPADALVEVVPRVASDGTQYLFVVNLRADRPREVEVAVEGDFTGVADLSCESRPSVPVERRGGRTFIPLKLHPGGGIFLRLGRPSAEPD